MHFHLDQLAIFDSLTVTCVNSRGYRTPHLWQHHNSWYLITAHSLTFRTGPGVKIGSATYCILLCGIESALIANPPAGSPRGFTEARPSSVTLFPPPPPPNCSGVCSIFLNIQKGESLVETKITFNQKQWLIFVVAAFLLLRQRKFFGDQRTMLPP